jgi:Domain of unknown function (DUF4261)
VKLFRRRQQEDAATLEAEHPRPIAVALVLAGDDAELTPEELVEAWGRLWPGRAAPEDVEEADGAIALTLDGESAAASVLPTAVPEAELEGLLDRSPLWPAAAAAAAGHSRHAIVSASGETPLAACLAATRLTCAVLDAMGGLGVYWSEAPQVVRADVFRELATTAADAEPPVLLWLRIGAQTEDDGTATVRTTGMRQLGLMDIEAVRAHMPAEDLHRIVTGVAEYLVVNGPVIADGDTIGGTHSERIGVSHRPSELEPGERVYALHVD